MSSLWMVFILAVSATGQTNQNNSVQTLNRTGLVDFIVRNSKSPYSGYHYKDTINANVTFSYVSSSESNIQKDVKNVISQKEDNFKVQNKKPIFQHLYRTLSPESQNKNIKAFESEKISVNTPKVHVDERQTICRSPPCLDISSSTIKPSSDLGHPKNNQIFSSYTDVYIHLLEPPTTTEASSRFFARTEGIKHIDDSRGQNQKDSSQTFTLSTKQRKVSIPDTVQEASQAFQNFVNIQNGKWHRKEAERKADNQPNFQNSIRFPEISRRQRSKQTENEKATSSFYPKNTFFRPKVFGNLLHGKKLDEGNSSASFRRRKKGGQLPSWFRLPPMIFFHQNPKGTVDGENISTKEDMDANSLNKRSKPVFEIAKSVHKRRRYDVPQIECPPKSDGTERFSCPSPDRMGRYKCIFDHAMCDGFIDCPNAEDEDRVSCMFYQTTKAHLDVLADALLRWARRRY